MIKAIIFDFDGVLFQTENEKLEQLKKRFRKFQIDDELINYNHLFGLNTSQLRVEIKNMMQESYVSIERTPSFYDDLMNDLDYTKIMAPKLERLLQELTQQGILCAIGSNSRKARIDEILKNTGIDKYFTVVVTSDVVQAYKPDPKVYLEVLNHCQLTAKETMIVEDSMVGLQAAAQTGCFVLALRNQKYKIDQQQSDVIIDRLDELLAYIN